MVDKAKQSSETRECNVARERQMVGNLWSDFNALVREDAGQQSVHFEDQAVHLARMSKGTTGH